MNEQAGAPGGSGEKPRILTRAFWGFTLVHGAVTAGLVYMMVLFFALTTCCPYHDTGWWPVVGPMLIWTIMLSFPIVTLYRLLGARKADGSFAPFQIHLSTLLLLVALAGILMGLNFAWGHPYIPGEGSSRTEYTVPGWPLRAAMQEQHPGGVTAVEQARYVANRRQLVLGEDAVICFSILVVVAIVCEWWIRRRAAEVPAPAAQEDVGDLDR